jgi:predicted nucleotidyltransferase component of viral defense system
MIPENFIEQWRVNAPWQTLAMVEQDLIISRVLVDLYNDPTIQNSLAFRGGTALNKLHIKPARYSEDIDLVQIKPESIGNTIGAIRSVLREWLGEPRWKITNRSAKLIFKFQTVDNVAAKLKIEINTTEHFCASGYENIKYHVNSEWFTGKVNIVTYSLPELMATKLRALYQRRKGRDLFDIWLVLDRNLIDVNEMIKIFEEYCKFNNQNITRALFEQSMAEKYQHKDFASDMRVLLTTEQYWDFKEAFDLVQKEVINKLPGQAWKGIA